MTAHWNDGFLADLCNRLGEKKSARVADFKIKIINEQQTKENKWSIRNK